MWYFAQKSYLCVLYGPHKENSDYFLIQQSLINLFITGAESVYCAVRDESLNLFSPNVNRDLQRVIDQ